MQKKENLGKRLMKQLTLNGEQKLQQVIQGQYTVAQLEWSILEIIIAWRTLNGIRTLKGINVADEGQGR